MRFRVVIRDKEFSTHHAGAMTQAFHETLAASATPEAVMEAAELVPLFIELTMPSCERHGEIVEFGKVKA